MQNQGFKHVGKVVSTELSGSDSSRGVVYISVDPIAACSGCKAKSQCRSISKGCEDGSDGSQSRVIKVECDRVEKFDVNDAVNVGVTYRIGVIAVVVAYIVPLVVFIAMLATLIAGFGVEQGIAAIATFVTLGIYYGVVYAFKDYFEKVVVFEIEKR